MSFFFFFFNDTATTEIYTLSLHDALPIYIGESIERRTARVVAVAVGRFAEQVIGARRSRRVIQNRLVVTPDVAGENNHRSEEHTSELQSRLHLVCRLLLEKKKKKRKTL